MALSLHRTSVYTSSSEHPVPYGLPESFQPCQNLFGSNLCHLRPFGNLSPFFLGHLWLQ